MEPVRFTRLHERVTLLMALTGFAALTVTGEVGPVTAAIGFGLMGLSAWRGRLPWLPTEAQWNRLTLFMLGFCLGMWHFFTHDLLPPIILFTLYLQVLRLLSPRSSRDALQVNVIAFGMLLLASVLTTSILFLPLFLAFGALAVISLVLLTIRREAERSAAPAGARWPAPTAAALSALASRRHLRGLGAVSIGLFVLAAGFFVALPRYQGNDWFRGLRRSTQAEGGETLSGAGETVSLGEISRIRLDHAIVMRVRLPSLVGMPPDHLRLRGQTLSTFDGQRWMHRPGEFEPASDLSPGATLRLDEGGPARPWMHAGETAEERLVQEITLDTGAPPQIFGQSRPVLFSMPQNLRLTIQLNDYGNWARLVDVTRVTDPVTYRIESVANDQVGVEPLTAAEPGRWKPVPIRADADPAWVAEQMRLRFYQVGRAARALHEHYTGRQRWGEHAGPIQALALRWAAEAGAQDPVSVANAIARRFHREFTYTLEPEVATPDFPIEGFLTQTRQGHCEYFATAMVLMLRTLGIPARLATGYYTREWNATGRFFVVRESHAHAWVEMFAPHAERGELPVLGGRPGGTWIPYDPTPPGGLPREASLTAWQRLLHWLDAHRHSWYRWVIDLGQPQQREIFRHLGLPFNNMSLSMLIAMHRLSRARLAPRPGDLLALLPLALGIAALVAGAVLVARRLRGRARRAPRRRAAVGPPVGFYLRLVRWLRRQGHVRPLGMTPAEFAQALVRERPAWAAVGPITELYYRQRYGGPLTEAELQRAEALVAALTGPRREPPLSTED